MTIANTAYGSGSYFDNIVFGWGLPITSRAENPTKLWYVAPTMAVHSRMRIAALDGRQRCFDGGHEMQILFCWSGEEESSLAVLTSKRLDSDEPPTTSCSRAIDHLSTTALLFSPAYLRNIGPTCLQYTISLLYGIGAGPRALMWLRFHLSHILPIHLTLGLGRTPNILFVHIHYRLDYRA